MNQSSIEKVGTYIGLVEIGVGGTLHALRIPFVGYILSLHQVLCLSFFTRQDQTAPRFFASQTSLVAAMFKLATPSSKPITPFLAITMQGMFYNLGTLILGRSLIGQIFGAILSSQWGFIQPLLFYTFIFGRPLLDSITLLTTIGKQYLPWLDLYAIIIACLIIKALLASVIAIYANHISLDNWESMQAKIHKFSMRFPTKNLIHHRSKSLRQSFFNFWFVFPLILSLGSYTYFHGIGIDLLKYFGFVMLTFFAFNIFVRKLPLSKLQTRILLINK